MVLRIAISGVAGNVGYSLVFRIAAGDLFGPDQPIALHLLERPEMVPVLKGIAMELEDCVFPCLKEVKIGSDPNTAFGDANFVFLVGAKPREKGMERKDLLLENGHIFVEHGKALKSAAKNVRVVVVGNPCNTNCLIAMHHAAGLKRSQFHALSRLDQNRAVRLLADRANVGVEEVADMGIWGNHSPTVVPAFAHAKIRGAPVLEVIRDRAWLENEFMAKVQKRGSEVMAARGKSSAASAAQAALDSIRSMAIGDGKWFSAGVATEGNCYGIAEDLVFSFPCRLREGGEWEIVPKLAVDPFLEKKLEAAQKELIEERDVVAHLLRGT